MNKVRTNKARIIVIESQKPMDMLKNITEQESLEKVCKLIGHQVITYNVKSKREFRNLCNFIATIDDSEEKYKLPLCIHISIHGDNEGVAIGEDNDVNWEELLKLLEPIFSNDNYSGVKILIISACGVNGNELTKQMKSSWLHNLDFVPPKYLFFTSEDEVYFDDTVVAWSIFYNKLPYIDIDNKREVQFILKCINYCKLGKIYYYRWDDKECEYMLYMPK